MSRSTPRQRSGNQRLLIGGSRRPDRRSDAAAGAGDVGIRHPEETLLELRGPVARINDVGMAVDEARRHQPAATVVGLGAGHVPGQCRGRPREDDASVPLGHRAVRDQFGRIAGEAGEAGVPEDA